jgi:hypothetical protein
MGMQSVTMVERVELIGQTPTSAIASDIMITTDNTQSS